MTQARFLEPAEREVEEAISYFDEQSQGLGVRFEKEVERTVAILTNHPEIGSLLTSRVRKFRLRKFRYNLIYVIDGDEIVILAVAHHKRRPGYWKTRVSKSL